MKTSKPEQVGCSSARLGRIAPVMQRYVDEGKIAGILPVVARRGHVVYAECFGMMDVEAHKPMQFDTLFRIYSMTKPITSVAVMMLYEEGFFQLTDPISRFVPGFEDVQVLIKTTESGLELAKLEREITIHHLLTHTSGLGYGIDEDDPVYEMIQERIWRVVEQRPDTNGPRSRQVAPCAPTGQRLALQPGH